MVDRAPQAIEKARNRLEKGLAPSASFDAYSCGSASGCTGTAEATGPGPAPSR